MSEGRGRWEATWARLSAMEPALHTAARTGDHASIRRLVEDGVDIDEVFDVQLDPGARRVFVSALGWAAGSAEGATASTVELLLELGASVEIDGARSPLLCALAGVDLRHPAGGDLERVELLAQAHLETFGTLPVDIAGGGWLKRTVATGDPRRVRFLLEHGAGANPSSLEVWASTPLDDAVENDDVDLVRLLLEFGADPNLRSFDLHFLLGTARSLAVLELLLDAGALIDPPIIGQPGRHSRDAAGKTLSEISCAREVARSERVVMIRTLVARASLHDSELVQALWHAAFDAADDEGVRALLEVGADPHGAPYLLASPCFGQRLDHHAGVEAVIDALVDAGLDPNDEDQAGFRPLLTALGPDTFGPDYQESDGYNRPAALALIRRGVDVNIRYPATGIPALEPVEVAGYTPLHLAARVGDGDVIRSLLDAGADPTVLTPEGRTAFDLAAVALEEITGPLASPPAPAPDGASDWKIASAAEERQRWDQRIEDARVGVAHLVAAANTPGQAGRT